MCLPVRGSPDAVLEARIAAQVAVRDRLATALRQAGGSAPARR
ncbi:hypothetical protein ACFZDB_15940 [Streptomyces luteogriseus]|nr:hypothetical protein [Streptomyces sp. NRRL S-475]